MNEDMVIVMQLVLSAVLGGLVGFLREREKKAAGLRTHMLVSLGSALLMILSIYMARFGGDPGRIAAQVVTGIGFLGAGTIIQGGEGVKGLTTAASIWVVSAVGLAVGAGFYTAALATTVLAVVIIQVLHVAEKYIKHNANI